MKTCAPALLPSLLVVLAACTPSISDPVPTQDGGSHGPTTGGALGADAGVPDAMAESPDGRFLSSSACPDADGDGYTTCDGDCDDADAAINPGAREPCDHVDNDCDGIVDNGSDKDADGWTICEGDCDEYDPSIYPGAPEDCSDGDDNDCDGDIDEDDADCAPCDTWDLGGASDFNVFVFGDYTGGLDVRGRAAAGGTLQMQYFSIALDNPGALAAVAGDTLDLDSGTVWGDGWYGVTDGVTSSVDFQGGALQQGQPIDFATAEADLVAASSAIGGLTATGTTTVESWGGVFLEGADPTLNVFSLDGADLEGAVYLWISAPAGSVALVNVSGTSLTFGGFYMDLSQVDETTLLWNFPDATSLSASSLGFRGSLLAPLADLAFSNGNFDGTIVAASLTGTAEGHWFPFDGEVEVCPGDEGDDGGGDTGFPDGIEL